jgi:hypothetical protein
VHHQQQRRLGVAELGMKDVQAVGMPKWFAGDPREVTTGLQPVPAAL